MWIYPHAYLLSNLPKQIRLGLGRLVSCTCAGTCVVSHFLYNDPHYVLGHYLIYMIILNNHVLWYIGMTLGCLVPNVYY